MADTAIQVEGLGKQYHIGAAQKERTASQFFRDVLMAPVDRIRRFGRSSHREEDTIWALKDVSFDVARGQVLGVIGRNGAGKSTLLKLLTRITEPTTGRAVIRGRVGSLLEVGTGFNQELTGRENIFLSGALLGMKRHEIRQRFNDIVDFSGVSKFLDTPIKRYSSGMRVRLGFAVAAHLDPEILLIDEVLAVGDAEFQRRCLGKMEGLTSQGRTILFVSHNMPSIEALCDRAILLEDGQISMEGESSEVVSGYLHKLRSQMACKGEVDLTSSVPRTTDGPPIFQRFRMLDSEGRPKTTYRIGEPIDLEVTLDTGDRILHNSALSLYVYNDRWQCVCAWHSDAMLQEVMKLQGRLTVTCHWGWCGLTPGRYSIAMSLRDRKDLIDRLTQFVEFGVEETDLFGTGKTTGRHGICVQPAQWEFKPI